MTRVLFACWPFEGHVFPQMSMALALRARGAEVAFYTDESRRELIESHGFELLPFQRVTRTWERVHGRDRGTGGRRQTLQLLREARAWIVDSIPDQVADLQNVIARWRPDVIGAEGSMWGPLLVLSELGPVPVGLVSPLIGGPTAEDLASSPPRGLAARAQRLATTPMRRRVDAIRARYRLGPMGRTVTEYFAGLRLYLVLSVPELDHGHRAMPESVHYVGFCQWHPPDQPGSAEWLDQLPNERPWVHVTEGTSRFEQPFLLRAGAQGLARAPVEVVMTTGRGLHARDAIGPADAPNLHVIDWLSHDVLLPKCAAIVTTGGMGTVMAALRAGIPLVVVPSGWDKPANAKRVVDAGVGVELSPRQCEPEALRAAVEDVLGDERYRRNAMRAAKLLAAAPGPAGAAELIENLAGSQPRAPRPRAASVGRASA